MRVFGVNLNEAFISFLGTRAQKGWLHSLEKEGEKIAKRIQEAENAETATLFARHIAPFIRSLTNERLCASILPDLVKRQNENRKLLDQHKAQISMAIVHRGISSSIALALNVAVLFVASRQQSFLPSDSRSSIPSITKPGGWEKFTDREKSVYINKFLTENKLHDYGSLVQKFGQVHIYERVIKPLLPPNEPIHKACRELIRVTTPDHPDNGDRLAGGFIRAFCPSNKRSQEEFFASWTSFIFSFFSNK